MTIPTRASRLFGRLRPFAAVAVGLAWIASFFLGCGWGWHGLHPLTPVSAPGGWTLLLTGLPALGFALWLWPTTPAVVDRTLAALLILLLLGEGYSHWRPPQPSPEITLLPSESAYNSRLYQPHHYTLFEPIPDIHTADGYVHNRLGFRDARPLHPDPTAIRLVVIGGPTVHGSLTRDNNELFTAQLERRLNDRYRDRLAGRHFEVINAGMADVTSAETLLRLIFAVSEIQPDLVAIQLGVSDTWPRVSSDDYRGDFRQIRKRWSHGRICAPKLSLADDLAQALVYRSALLNRWLGDRLPAEPLLEVTNHNNSGKIERLKTNPPTYYERHLRYMLAIIKSMGAEAWLIGDVLPVGKKPDGLYQRAVPEHNAVMARLAAETGTPFLDLATALPLTDDIRQMDKYLNAEGHRRQAELMENYLATQEGIEQFLNRKPSALTTDAHEPQAAH
jgi:lysophospholipase L1-like esterase